MSPPTLFADLRLASGHNTRPSISFHKIQPPDEHAEHCIQRFFRVSDRVLFPDNVLHPLFTDDYCEAFSRDKEATEKVLKLLNGLPALPATQKASESLETSFSCDPYAICGKTALVGTRGVETMKSYQDVNFQFSIEGAEPGRYNFSSNQSLHFSCLPSEVEEAMIRGVSGFDTVEILSGTCLFSGTLLAQSLQDGVNAEVLSVAKPTLYEMEYVARASHTISNIASLIICRRQGLDAPKTILPLNISLDVPNFHYYPSVFGKLDQRLCTTDEALQWMDAIDRRHDQIGSVIEKAIYREIHKRIPTATHHYKICVTQSDNLVANSIRKSLINGKVPSLAELLRHLSEQPDGRWREFYGLLKRSERPKDFRSLGYLFYVFEVIKKALARSSSVALEALREPYTCQNIDRDVISRRLLISIDDIAEFRIYTKAQKYLKRIRDTTMAKPTLLEIYPCQRMFVDGNQRAHFYVDDPSPQHPLAVNETSEKLNLQATLSPSDVVEKLYGQECAKNLNGLFKEVGL
ncbi:hypothetical protein B0J14DRAFT_564250 [Halenospora varia]|nr:hypothetical protein B0J14DRAFT_564250 [Halenospora varia]